MTHPAVYQADDFTPPADKFTVREDPGIWYVLAFDGERNTELLGLFVLVQLSPICWEIHTRLLPGSWGKQAAEAARGILAWLWERTPCLRLVTAVPAYNRLAIRFAERAGLKVFGNNERSYLKGGVLHDQILLGISKPV